MPSIAVRRRHERAQALMLAVTQCARFVEAAHRERPEPVRLGREPVEDVLRLQLDLAREVCDAADVLLEADICHFAGAGDELAPRRRLRQAVGDLVDGLNSLPEGWRPAVLPRAQDFIAKPRQRRVLARLVRYKLVGLARAADAGKAPGRALAVAAAAGLRESLGRLERAERDLHIAPAERALSWHRRSVAIVEFDRVWRRTTSRLRRLYRQVGLAEALAGLEPARRTRPPAPALAHRDKNRANQLDAPAPPPVGGSDGGRKSAAERGARRLSTTPKGDS